MKEDPIMKKIAALLLAIVLFLSCTSALAENLYFGNWVYCEAGYENDVYDGVAYFLILRDDGTFLYVENTSIIHVSYEVKANWAYIVEGTYTIDSDDEGTKEVTLKGETVTFVMMGNPTTSEEDPELLEDYEEFRVEVDDDSFRVKLLDD